MKNPKRFNNLLRATANQSPDPSTKVGALIVAIDEEGRDFIISTGFNRMPQGSDKFPWGVDAQEFVNTKYPYVVHAEMDAILGITNSLFNEDHELEMIVSINPCVACARHIAHLGITKVYYHEYRNCSEAELLFKKLNIELIQIK